MSEVMTGASLRRILDEYLKNAVASVEGEVEFLESGRSRERSASEKPEGGTSASLRLIANSLRRAAEMVRRTLSKI